jgi:hypothetical protein
MNRFTGFASLLKRLKSDRRGRLVSVIALAVLIACAALGFVVRAYNRRQPVADIVNQPKEIAVSPAPDKPALAQADSRNDKVEASVITLRPSGFDPKEITRSEGRILLVVVNRTGLEETALTLDRQTGGRLRAAPVNRRTPRWGEIFNLTPGKYVLSEENHPQWTCTITVTAR